MRPRFGRALAAFLLSGLTLAVASGCQTVSLADEWPAMTEPSGWEPKAGVCTNDFAETSYRASYKPADCAGGHTYETVFVGKFTGDAASQTTPPARGNALLAPAWAECDTKTSEFLGGPWRDGKIWIGVSVPAKGSWEAGARWFRCEVMTSPDRYRERPAIRSGSLKGAFAGASDLKFGCYNMPEDTKAEWAVVDCGSAHNGEYVGSFAATGEYDQLKDNESHHQKCRSLIAGYAAVPDDGNMKYRSGTYISFPSKQDWADGDRHLRCHLWMGKKTLTGSAKGAGAKYLPIN